MTNTFDDWGAIQSLALALREDTAANRAALQRGAAAVGLPVARFRRGVVNVSYLTAPNGLDALDIAAARGLVAIAAGVR